MPDRDRYSRELSENELPAEAREELEEARTVHRKALPLAGRAGGSEERAGIETTPHELPVIAKPLPIQPPPENLPK
jgi:hypothetical protein